MGADVILVFVGVVDLDHMISHIGLDYMSVMWVYDLIHICVMWAYAKSHVGCLLGDLGYI